MNLLSERQNCGRSVTKVNRTLLVCINFEHTVVISIHGSAWCIQVRAHSEFITSWYNAPERCPKGCYYAVATANATTTTYLGALCVYIMLFIQIYHFYVIRNYSPRNCHCHYFNVPSMNAANLNVIIIYTFSYRHI